ncbi:uncharacterized protein LOC119390599 [Rhipicephalus sanguineus]|uniref:uncharacterized protein LOC119390599 n=1 Tax=Rhipicephalus sanguineus TaxID=34632 RepID=UPI0020C4D56E|nr:uncharacterized protein LOC119390599 [Rhipicephalus sanguineus]
MPPQFRRQTPPPPPTPSRPPASQRYTAQKTDVWRAPDNRPLCYHCGEAGHTYHRCQYRQMGLRGFAVNAPRPQPGERPRDIDDYLTGTQWQERRPSRSPSPGRYMSPHRRQYTGPNRGECTAGCIPKLVWNCAVCDNQFRLRRWKTWGTGR